MPTHRRDGFGRSGINRRWAGVLIAAFAFLFSLGQTRSAIAAPAISEHSVKADPGAVARSWNRQDLLTAEPAPMPTPPEASFDLPDFDAGVSASKGPFYPLDPTAFPERVQGKVFFSIGSNRYQCSGTLVNSRNGNIVYTAGHCVWDVETQGWVTKWVFIPGYSNGTSPFKTYAATSLSTPSGYSGEGNFSYDIGMATVDGNPEADLGGARQIAFNLNPANRRYTLYGYPAAPDPPYDGETLVGCRSSAGARDGTAPQTIGVLPCNMRQGASGGGWITGGNYLNSVTSYTYCDTDPELCDIVWGPHFSNAAESLYTSEAAGGSAAPTVRVRFSPPGVVRKRRVLFKLDGAGATPVRFQCRLDHKRFDKCAARTKVPRLNPGRHVFRVRSVDQTGHVSGKTIKKSFKVLPKKKKRRR